MKFEIKIELFVYEDIKIYKCKKWIWTKLLCNSLACDIKNADLLLLINVQLIMIWGFFFFFLYVYNCK